MEIEVRENEIEDILALYPDFLKNILRLPGEILLIARQKLLPSGRLDLVFSHRNNLLLIELKVEPFKKSFVRQVCSYRADLKHLQSQGRFISGELLSYLLCPTITSAESRFSQQEDVEAVVYDPGVLLTDFYRRAPLDTRYFSVVPSDKGVWRIGLIHESLSLVPRTGRLREIAQERNLSSKTVGNQFRLAEELGLIFVDGGVFKLTSFGQEYLKARDDLAPIDTISSDQGSVIRKFILTNPFFSGATFGILTMVACIFELSKNTYPVPLEMLSRHFINAAGLHFHWNKDKAIGHGVRMYSNYAIDLGLIGRIGNSYFVTPSGLSFVLLLNMHKSIKFIEAIKSIR
jgi:hypothetical protein